MDIAGSIHLKYTLPRPKFIVRMIELMSKLKQRIRRISSSPLWSSHQTMPPLMIEGTAISFMGASLHDASEISKISLDCAWLHLEGAGGYWNDIFLDILYMMTWYSVCIFKFIILQGREYLRIRNQLINL